MRDYNLGKHKAQVAPKSTSLTPLRCFQKIQSARSIRTIRQGWPVTQKKRRDGVIVRRGQEKTGKDRKIYNLGFIFDITIMSLC